MVSVIGQYVEFSVSSEVFVLTQYFVSQAHQFSSPLLALMPELSNLQYYAVSAIVTTKALK